MLLSPLCEVFCYIPLNRNKIKNINTILITMPANSIIQAKASMM
uniref:Uncharacterized protein n=1 Tax=uncultured bacterium contig00015 TaxID=1181506 RepID=A0A806K2P2_9BACT|nr:hypothetical protein [uncultured bacterium contig00015]